MFAIKKKISFCIFYRQKQRPIMGLFVWFCFAFDEAGTFLTMSGHQPYKLWLIATYSANLYLTHSLGKNREWISTNVRWAQLQSILQCTKLSILSTYTCQRRLVKWGGIEPRSNWLCLPVQSELQFLQRKRSI